jgi:4,5-DOPA dioxygenase extradiol
MPTLSPPLPRTPAVFFGHGSPMNALSQNRYTDAWRRIGESMTRPRAILAISAHWYTRGIKLTAMTAPPTIHDFGGFPRELFEIQYPAPGSPELAARIRDLLAPLDVQLDESWGLDHGTWSVLLHAFPAADVPVVQLSMDATQPAEFHYALGEKLGKLRDEDILVMGSGNVIHNLGVMRREENAPPYEWAERFNAQLRAHIERRDYRPLINYQQWGDDARRSVPTPEHYLPLLYVIGQQRNDEAVAFPVDGIELGSIGMLSVLVGAANTSGESVSV